MTTACWLLGSVVWPVVHWGLVAVGAGFLLVLGAALLVDGWLR